MTDDLTQTWRTSVGYLLQDPFLFHDTIRANLLVSKPDADERELKAALASSGAATFVDALPLGTDTIVGDRGARLSGGESHRLALARALLRDPALLIPDEPTSSLDESNERTVLEGVELLKGRVTMILATHRPQHVQFDQLFRIADGKVERAGHGN